MRRKGIYSLLDVAFTAAAVYLVINGQWTNGLICWGISELYALHIRLSS